MDHIAIMKKEWGLIPLILKGEKTVESRWYKMRIAPWDKIGVEDTLYFKDSGNPVTVKAAVTRVEQYTIENNQHATELAQKYAKGDLGTEKIPGQIANYVEGKKYAIFVYFDKVEKVTPFNINKKGFGMQCAWLTVENVEKIKV